MSKVEQAIKALEHAQDIDSFYPGGDRIGVRQCIDKALEVLRDCQDHAIPEGFIPYDGSGQPVADDVVVDVFLRDGDVSEEPEEAEGWDWSIAKTNNDGDIIAYRIIHDPALLPDVPWEDYPEARWATLNGSGYMLFWADGNEPDCRNGPWMSHDGTSWVTGRLCDMAHLDPARCKWERPITPGAYKDADGRQPATEDGDSVALIVPDPVRKSIDDAKPEEWDRAAKIDREGRISYSGKRKPTIDERLAALEAEVFRK